MNTTTINPELFGQDPKIKKSIAAARNVSVTKAPVLVVGERGVGKRTLATYIHQESTRADQSFTVVDCSAQSKDVSNQILGYRDEETGRFNKGALETSNGGTLVLANIDGLEDEFQKRLTQIINELADYDIDVRIISTTTKNLSKLVGSGRFYRGLYNLVSSNQITLSPLRERETDLLLLVEHFAGGRTIEDNAKSKLLSHYWTHNVAELESVITCAIEKAGESGSLTEELVEIGEKKSVNMISEDESEGIRLMSLKEAEKLLIKKALIHTSENRTQAAKILGVSIRTLRNKINEYRSTGNAYFVNLR